MFRHAADGFPEISDARLEMLGEIEELARALDVPGKPHPRETVQRLSARLRDFHRGCRRWADSMAPAGGFPPDVAASMYTAVRCLPGLASMPGTGPLRSVEAPTMDAYRSDYCGAPIDAAALAHALGLTEEERAGLDRYVDECLERLDSVHRVMDAVRESAGLGNPGQAPDREAVLRLLRKIYPACDLTTGEVGLHWTRCTAHFAVFVEQTRGSGYSEFWDSVNGFRLPYYDHFPMFGFLDTAGSDHDWVKEVSERSGETLASTRRILDASLMALKGETLEKYLLHDVWGHRWQGIFTRWKAFYDQLKLQDESLVATESYSEDGRSIPFGTLLSRRVEGSGLAWSYDPEALHRWLKKEAQERLTLAFTQILSELTADLTEHKYGLVKPQAAPPLENSSAFPGVPCKTDLSLADFRHIWKSVFGPFQDIRQKSNVLAKSIYDAHRWDLPAGIRPETLRRSLEPLVDELVAGVEAFHRDYLTPEVRMGPEGPGLYAMGVGNVLELHEALDGLCRLEVREDRRLCEGHLDLLCLFVAQFFERLPSRNFWILDETLSSSFLGLTERVKSVGGRVFSPGNVAGNASDV